MTRTKYEEKKNKVTDQSFKNVINLEGENNEDNDTSLVNIMERINKSKGIKEYT